ncbi:DUF4232 domain-containing protein [Streptomyces sp. BE147]|uniref:DUF4232 domain-containing protein n=1 Tax=unclassified Streptomyces TaxID=2593676 RepID=UPI002E78C1DB|nr:DUF4232 domain-containing protein [Streptomyces sp. BE147]MEE1737427.1 DUF4232 domain-containing protein [Streptomyces sp. BE147]
MGKPVRRAVVALWTAAAGVTLTGCAGFLVPAGEGEPEPTPSATRTVPHGVHADTLPPTPAAPQSPPATGGPGGGVVTGPPATAPAASGDCPASGVVVDMGQVETAMMHRAVVLTLTNCGDKPYRVRGYPSVQALGEDGERLPVKVNPGGSYFGQDPGPKEVVLKPGASVKSILAWVSTKEGGDLIEGDALEIAAATDTGARVFPLEGHDIRLMDELNMTAWRTRLST